MLRFLSNYLFQNENQPNENDPSSVTTHSSEQQPGPSSDKSTSHDNLEENRDKAGGGKGDEFMDLEMRDEEEEDDDEDDWVLIGEGKRKQEKDEKQVAKQEDDLRVQCQPVNLVAAPSTEEEDEEDDNEESEDSEDEEEEENKEEGLMWENKLIEHPSMSVYVDLATSVNSSNGVTASCVSLSSIFPASSPGESVIVLEQPDSDLDESMDFVENTENTIDPPVLKQTGAKSGTANPVSPPVVQNGRRKKGHYPCSSSNSSQMPRRAHLRSCAGGNTTSSNSASFILGATSDNSGSNTTTSDAIKRIKHNQQRGNNQTGSGATTANATTVSACGIAMVNGGTSVPPSPNSNGMLNKNLKLIEMFPTASAASKRRQRRNANPQKSGATPKGHILQEAKRRQDMQNYTKRSFVNNDRRSAQQRRVQKTPANGSNAK